VHSREKKHIGPQFRISPQEPRDRDL
jgi:hypothetical protein